MRVTGSSTERIIVTCSMWYVKYVYIYMKCEGMAQNEIMWNCTIRAEI